MERPGVPALLASPGQAGCSSYNATTEAIGGWRRRPGTASDGRRQRGNAAPPRPPKPLRRGCTWHVTPDRKCDNYTMGDVLCSLYLEPKEESQKRPPQRLVTGVVSAGGASQLRCREPGLRQTRGFRPRRRRRLRCRGSRRPPRRGRCELDILPALKDGTPLRGQVVGSFPGCC